MGFYGLYISIRSREAFYLRLALDSGQIEARVHSDLAMHQSIVKDSLDDAFLIINYLLAKALSGEFAKVCNDVERRDLVDRDALELALDLIVPRFVHTH